jgi:hypothetical protein
MQAGREAATSKARGGLRRSLVARFAKLGCCDHERSRCDAERSEPEPLVEACSVVVGRVDHDGSHGYLFGRYSDTAQGIVEHRGAEPLTMVLAVGRRSRE